MKETCHPRPGGVSQRETGVSGISFHRKILSDELHRLLDERMHVAVVIDERNDLTVAGEDLLYAP